MEIKFLVRNPEGQKQFGNTDIDVMITSELMIHTGCSRRTGQNFGRVLLMLNYTDITQNTYIQS